MNGRMEGIYEKLEKQCLEINKLSTLTSCKISLKNAIKVRVFFTVILNHLTSGGGGKGVVTPHRGVLPTRKTTLFLNRK